MRICSNCGCQLPDVSAFCNICGYKIEAQTSAKYFATREESIWFARNMLSGYETLENLTVEINDLESQLKKRQTSKPRRYSTFKFFWPSIIVAFVAYLVMMIVTMVITANTMKNTLHSSFAFTTYGFIFSIIIIPVVLLVGLVVATILRNKANAELEEQDAAIANELEGIQQRIVELRNKQSEIAAEMTVYNDLIPFNMRNKIYMQKIINLLETYQAKTFEEAIAILKYPRM